MARDGVNNYYYIGIGGRSKDSREGFELTISQTISECVLPTEIQLPSSGESVSVVGSTFNATGHGMNCGKSSPMVWYKVFGTAAGKLKLLLAPAKQTSQHKLY